MKRVVIIFAATFILLHCSKVSFSQKSDSGILVDTTVIDKSSNENDDDEKDTVVNRIHFAREDDSIKGYRSNKEFGYMKYLDSFLKATKGMTVDTISTNKLNGQYRKSNSSESTPVSETRVNIFSSPLVKILFWALAIFFIGFIIYKLFLSDGLFRRNTLQQKTGSGDDTEEALDPGAYESLIATALKNKNFRLAVRYLYLQTLQNLSAAGVIQFSADKTNYEYVREINNKPYQKDFASLTLNYEYIWYGKFDISEDNYQRLQKNFRSFQRNL